VIAFRRFTKRFGQQLAVDDLSLEIGRGEVVALLGPNGSGKTTSLKAAAGLIGPTSGEVVIGEPLRPALDPTARRQTSYLPQKVSFPESLTGAEVVEFYRELRGAAPSRSLEALRAAALNGAGDRTVGTYSGGMVQRLGLAVAMVPDAPVLLLDEPTAALDPDGLCTFYGLVERRRDEGRTVLFTSHQLGDVERLADRVAVLVNGRLAATFTESELADRLADRGVMRVRIAGAGAAVPDDKNALLARVRTVAPRATWSGVDLVVPGPVAQRPRVIAELQACGVELLAITAEEGRLDSFYRELLSGGQNTGT
jgi:Cu-processing system ATP-binding protein